MLSTNNNTTETRTPVVNNYFHYFVSIGRLRISDLEYCDKSERTLDVKLFDIANNESLLNKLHLYYIQGNYGNTVTYQGRAEWFCGYLSSFKSGVRSDLQYEKSLTNPTVRILVEDASLFEDIKNCLK